MGYKMTAEFGMDTFKDFLTQLEAGNIEPYIKSEPVPDNSAAGVKVAVAKNFDELSQRARRTCWSSSTLRGADTARSLPPSMMNLARKWLRKMLRLLKWTQQLMMFPQSSTLRASQRFTGCLREQRSQFLIMEVGSWTTSLNTLPRMLLMN